MFYEEMAEFVDEILSEPELGLGQPSIILYKTTVTPATDPRQDPTRSTTPETLKAVVEGELASMMEGVTVRTGELTIIARPPRTIDWRDLKSADGRTTASITLGGGPHLNITKIEAIPPVGTTVALLFLVEGA